MVEIVLYGPFREAVGRKTVDHRMDDESTVDELFRSLSEAYPSVEPHLLRDGTLRESINVMKNGRNVRLLDGGETMVEDGDRLTVTVSLEGG